MLTPGTFPVEDCGRMNIDKHLNRLPTSVIEFQGPSYRTPKIGHLSSIALVGSIPVVAIFDMNSNC